MDIAKMIRELRESVGENRTEFSKHTGIPVRTIEDWESGRRTPPEYIEITEELLREKLYEVRGQKVMLDYDDCVKIGLNRKSLIESRFSRRSPISLTGKEAA